MKKYFLMAVCVMAMVAGLSSCSKDDEKDGDKSTLESNLVEKAWMLDNQDSGRIFFFKNHLLVYLGANEIPTSYMQDYEFAVGTWRDKGDVLNTKFNAKTLNMWGALGKYMPNSMTVLNTENGRIRLEDEAYKDYTLKAVGTWNDYSDATECDKALHGKWVKKVIYSNKDFENVIEREMTFYNDGTIYYFTPEKDTEYTTYYKTKDGRVDIDNYENRGKITLYYIRMDDKLLTFSDNGKYLYLYDIWTKVQ